MMDKKNLGSLLITIILITGLIYYLESHKPGRSISTNIASELTSNTMPTEEKDRKFMKAKELVNPSGYINTDTLKLNDLVGKQVILVDFWTYSCINCQRTLPYLNSWNETYGDQGLTIVGVHTPEFEFEQKKENVQAAVDKYGIAYPVVLDNMYATWQAYGNRYWPRKYLIDIDGYIVYDHIGEGGYEETEAKIQELLQERSQRLGTTFTSNKNIAQPTKASTRAAQNISPETYFGSQRNEYLANGIKFKTGIQQLAQSGNGALNEVYLQGTWDFQPEYASNVSIPASIATTYQGKDVYMVASAKNPVIVEVLRDGKSLTSADAGEDVEISDATSTVTIQGDRLYKLIEDATPGQHALELRIKGEGLQVFTFTFG